MRISMDAITIRLIEYAQFCFMGLAFFVTLALILMQGVVNHLHIYHILPYVPNS